MTASRRHVARLAVVLFGLTAPLVAAELALRASGYQPYAHWLAGESLFLRPSSHPLVPYELRPGAQGIAWGANVRINSLGLRDHEYSQRKPAGTLRILVLGDSIAFGNDLQLEQTFPKQLERFLKPHARPIEVLNLGVGGFDTLGEVALLEHRGIALEPDLVLIAFCINDAGTVSMNLRSVPGLDLGRALHRLRLFQFLYRRLEMRARAEDFTRLSREEAFEQANRDVIEPIGAEPELERRMRELGLHLEASYDPRDPHRGFLAWYTSKPRLGKLRHAFEKLQRLQTAHGFETLIVFLPGIDQAEHGAAYELTRDVVKHEADRVGLEMIDTLEEFGAAGIEKLRLGPRDFIHPNAEGHRLVASRIWKHLTTRFDEDLRPRRAR
jgi:lysophospholipase L1-like esterase